MGIEELSVKSQFILINERFLITASEFTPEMEIHSYTGQLEALKIQGRVTLSFQVWNYKIPYENSIFHTNVSHLYHLRWFGIKFFGGTHANLKLFGISVICIPL